MKALIKKAEVLMEALPYIKKFYQKPFVFKYGGKVRGKEKDTFCEDVVLLQYVGIKPVIVHGGGPQINQVLQRLGIEVKFEKGVRVTDDETMEWVEAVLQGQMNKELVREINRLGGKALGLSGSDGNLIVAERVKDKNLGRVGEVKRVNRELLQSIMDAGYIPVISPIGVDEDGVSLNINADTVSAEIAVAIKAEKLFILTDVDGVMDRRGKLIKTLDVKEAEKLLEENGEITGGMIPKLQCCMECVKKGVKKAHIINGGIQHAILLEIFTDRGIGTEIIAKE